MRTRRTILAAALLGLLGHVLVCDIAAADDYETVRLDHMARDHRDRAPQRQQLRVRVLATPAGNRHGGYGYVTVHLDNPSEVPAGLRLVIHPGWGWGSSGSDAVVRFTKTEQLEPGQHTTLHLPVPNTRHGAALSITVTGNGRSDEVSLSGRGTRGSGETSVLTIWPDDMARHTRWATFLSALTPKGSSHGGNPLSVFNRQASSLPDRWMLLSGFDLIIVDVARAELTPEQERVLKRYVAGGGNLALLEMRDASDGPLRELLEGEDLPDDGRRLSGAHGLGRWVAMAHGDATNLGLRELEPWLATSSRSGGYGVMAAAQRRFSGSIPTPFWLPLGIPGLGEVPVKAFFFLLLLFAIVVGPVNYIYFRRRKRLPMLLVTIPAMGFTCTLLILLYGFFSEGFGIVGSTRTFTVLDQRDHTAACCASRTLFAGLQPGALEPDADSFFHSAHFASDGGYRSVEGMFRASLDGGFHVEGSALPSRTPTPFTTVAVGRARERLRFRRRPDGGFDVLSAPGYVALEAEGAVLLRTHDGAYYRMDAQGVLRPEQLDRKAAFEQATEVVEPLAAMPIGSGVIRDDDYYYGGSGREYITADHMATFALGEAGLDKWLHARLRTLPKGSYLARTRQAPLFDDLGLDVTWRDARHVVLGRLAEEDVIDE